MSSKNGRISSCKSKKRKLTDVVSSSLSYELEKLLMRVIPKYINISELQFQEPKKYNKKLVVKLGAVNANKYIFYYASKERKQNSRNCLKLLKKNIAYKGFKNFGITKTNSKGDATFRFLCPQPYKENDKLYVSHVHFLMQESEMRWQEQLFTVGVICSIEPKALYRLIRDNCGIVFNSSELEQYMVQNIPESHPLPSSMVKNSDDIKKYIKSIINGNKKLKNKFERAKIPLLEFPIIVYCNESQCTSTDILLNTLWRQGFKNLRVYSGSIYEYLQINKI